MVNRTPLLDNEEDEEQLQITALTSTANPTAISKMSNDNALNAKNYINLVVFVLNFIVTYGIGVLGAFDLPNNGDLSKKYQSIVTPAGWAFSIWSIIFIAQAIFVVVQMLPSFRSLSLIQGGVGYWYLAASLFQIGWTVAFSLEVIPLSLIFMLSILGSLLGLLYSQSRNDIEEESSITTYWLLKFPFQILTGWIIAASAVNVNVQVVASDLTASAQLAFGIVSLAVLHAIALSATFYDRDSPNYVIPSVLAWATGAVAAELNSPITLITDTFSTDTIGGVRYASLSVCVIILVQMAIRLVMSLIAKN